MCSKLCWHQLQQPVTVICMWVAYKGVVNNYGEGPGATKREEGGGGEFVQVKFYPYQKGEQETFSHAEVGRA